MSRLLRLGIIGCGEVVQRCHLPSLALLPDLIAVSAVSDVSRTVVDAVGARLGVDHRFTDARDLLADPTVDAVLVATPHAHHAETALAALAAGKHVLVEKPLCLTLREADAIIAAQRATGLTVQVGTMRRHAPAFGDACRLIAGLDEVRLARVHDVIGRNALVNAQLAPVVRGDDVPAAAVEDSQALLARLLDEAVGPEAPPDLRVAYQLLLGLSSHDTSTMREALGRPRAVLHASYRRGGRWITAVFDYGDFVCQFETGVDEIPRVDIHLEVYGADRTVRVEWGNPFVRHLPMRLVVTSANGRGGVETRAEQPDWGDAFVEEWRTFARDVAAGRPAKSSPADFREDLELYAAMVTLMRDRHARS